MDAQEIRQFSPDDLTPEVLAMTLEEFLESDLEDYEYVKGELVPAPPTSAEHGRISTNLFLPLGVYVRENQFSKTVTVYRSETNITLLTRDDTLTGEDVVEGFSCQVAELFE